MKPLKRLWVKVDTCVRAATANLGKIQIELLQPLCGPSTHMESLNRQGQGVHHLSFGGVRDHDQIISSLEKEGIETESTGIIGGVSTFTYLATQDELGTILELGKGKPGEKSSLKPYGVYPPTDS